LTAADLLLEPRWVVAQTHPQNEPRAATHIIRQGGEVFAPLFYDKPKAGRAEHRIQRMFPGYLFVHVEGPAAWLRSTMGVLRVLCMGSQACVVPPAVIESYEVLADESGVVVLPEDRFTPGRRVQIIEGPFENCIGIVEGMDAQQRVLVLLSMLGRASRVHCPVAKLRAI
jgi:transcriptional antiterminator RfaH